MRQPESQEKWSIGDMRGDDAYSDETRVTGHGRRAPKVADRAHWMLDEQSDAADPYTSAKQHAVRPRPAPAPAPQSARHDGPPRLTLPSHPAIPAVPKRGTSATGRMRAARQRLHLSRQDAYDPADSWERDGSDSDAEWEAAARSWDDEPRRTREHSAARPLSLVSTPPEGVPLLDEPEYPARQTDMRLARYTPKAPQRIARNTQRVLRQATQPWWIVRAVLTALVLCFTLSYSAKAAGEPSQPLQSAAYQTAVGAHVAHDAPVVSKVFPETQGMRPDLYDSTDQFNNWWDAACSAAALSEILTAYGVPNATIGHEIDELGPDISPDAGLLSFHGFTAVAAKHNLQAIIGSSMSYSQMLYVANTLGLPIIVNVRISYGYYHFFSGGHFLVVTGGDDQGLRIVDSSEYYIKYLPKDVFYQMFTGRTVIIAPASQTVTLP